MRYTTDTGYPFDTDNRAYRRFQDLLGEHFDVVGWDNADTGRPTMTTLIDIASGDTWQPTAHPDRTVDPLIVALRPAPTEACTV